MTGRICTLPACHAQIYNTQMTAAAVRGYKEEAEEAEAAYKRKQVRTQREAQRSDSILRSCWSLHHAVNVRTADAAVALRDLLWLRLILEDQVHNDFLVATALPTH